MSCFIVILMVIHISDVFFLLLAIVGYWEGVYTEVQRVNFVGYTEGEGGSPRL